MMNFLTVFQSIKIQAKISMRVLMTSTQSERLNPKAASSRTADARCAAGSDIDRCIEKVD